MRALFALLFIALAGCAGPAPAPFDPDVLLFLLDSPAFFHEGAIPSPYTCDGDGRSPALHWEGAPEATTHYALAMDDPDAKAGNWVHWLWWDLPANVTALPAAADVTSVGATLGANTAGAAAYAGPCPSSGTHRYVFTVFALDGPLGLPTGSDREAFDAALGEHVVAKAVLYGTYARA